MEILRCAQDDNTGIIRGWFFCQREPSPLDFFARENRPHWTATSISYIEFGLLGLLS